MKKRNHQHWDDLLIGHGFQFLSPFPLKNDYALNLQHFKENKITTELRRIIFYFFSDVEKMKICEFGLMDRHSRMTLRQSKSHLSLLPNHLFRMKYHTYTKYYFPISNSYSSYAYPFYFMGNSQRFPLYNFIISLNENGRRIRLSLIHI